MAGGSDSPIMLRLVSIALRVGLCLLVLGVGVGIAGWLIGTRAEPARVPATEHAVAVRAVAARAVSIPRIWEGYGTARAMNSANVAAQVSARVIERSPAIEPGARVQAGDVLVRLDPVDFQQRVEGSRSLIASWEAQVAALGVEERRLTDQLELMQDEIRLEERELQRTVSVVEQRGANELEIERRQGVLNRRRRELSVMQQQVESIPPKREQLRAMVGNEGANLRLAEENLERATVKAPIAGVLQDVFVEQGELLRVGDPVARIVDLTRIEVPLRLPVSAAERLAAGDAAELWSDSPGSGAAPARWLGTIVRIAPEADAASRTMSAFVEVVQEGPGGPPLRGGVPVAAAIGPPLLPGQFVVGRVTTAAAESRVVVPRSAVNGDRIMVVENGSGGTRARAAGVRVLYHTRRSIPEIDPQESEWAVLEEGPEPGSLVITTNLDDLREGTPVRVEPAGAVAKEGEESDSANPGGGS